MNPKQIEALQRKLAEQGLYTGEIDGVMGPETKAARDFPYLGTQ
jgi:peptidoglycan hydrolase-like protein with peptidoglycan-binding domain